MKILSIDINLSGNNISSTELESSASLFDFEVVLYNPFKYVEKCTLNRRLSYADYSALHLNLKRRKREISEFLKSGGVVIYYPHADYAYQYIDNRGNFVDGKISDYIFEDEIVEKLVGEKFELIANNNSVKNFFATTLSLYFYRVNFRQLDAFHSCLKIPKTEKIVGGYWETSVNGRLLLSPMPKLNSTKNNSIYLEALIKLFEELHKPANAAFELPNWHSEYLLPNESIAIEAVKKAEEDIARSIATLQVAKEKKDNIEMLKTLVTATGEDLERMVHQVLNKLGLPVEFGEVGRADLIGSYNTQPVVIEVKGKSNKGAAEADAAQLEKWASSYHAETEVQPKGILIVNGYASFPLSERKEPVFPNQMLKYCESRGHCLISGLQLLCMYLETYDNSANQQKFIEELLQHVGVYPRYQNHQWTEIISVIA